MRETYDVNAMVRSAERRGLALQLTYHPEAREWTCEIDGYGCVRDSRGDHAMYLALRSVTESEVMRLRCVRNW